MKPETKEKIKKILNISVWCILIVGLVVCLGFVEKQENDLVGKNLIIHIDQDDESYFVQKDDIRELIRDRGDSVINQPVSSINIPALENVLNSHASIAKAEVSMSVNGDLKVDIVQRKPIIRVINANNESYYIDDTGKLMPLSEKYTAKVLVANGYIYEPYARRYMYSISDILKFPNIIEKTVLDDLYELAQYINADGFWKAQIEQIYINKENEIELIPRVGDHSIVLGDISGMDEKFKKLMIFYKEGMNTTGLWNNYSSINIKYKDQIVCTKKEETSVPKPKLKAELPKDNKEKKKVAEESVVKKSGPNEDKPVSKSKKRKKHRTKKLK